MSTHRRWLQQDPVSNEAEGTLVLVLLDEPNSPFEIGDVAWNNDGDIFSGNAFRGDLPEAVAAELFPDEPSNLAELLMKPVWVEGQVCAGCAFVRLYTEEQRNEREQRLQATVS